MGADVMDDLPAGFKLDEPAAGGIPAGFKLDETTADREKALRTQYGKEIAQRGEPSYGERFIDAATMGLTRPLSGVVRAAGGIFDPNSTAGERYRAGVGAAEDYFKKGEENTAGVGGFATDVAGAIAAPPIGKIATLGKGAVQGGRELLGRIIAQGATTGAVEGAARNAKDVGSAVEGGVVGGGLGAASAGAVGGATKLIPGVRGAVKGAEKEVREVARGESPEAMKAAAGRIYQQLDNAGLAYGQPQTKDLAKGIDDLITSNQYNKIAHSKISGYVDELTQKAQQPQGMTFTELHNLRSALSKETRGSDASTREAAGKVIGEIDKLIQNRPAINPNNLPDVGKIHDIARKAWRAASVADDVGWTAGKAERRAAASSGVNPDEANRAAFRTVENRVSKPGAYDPFTPDQRELLSRIVQGDRGQNFLRGAGEVAGSPTTRLLLGGAAGAAGLTGALAPLGAIGGGIAAAGGGLAKRGFDRWAASRGEANIDALIRSISERGRIGAPPQLSPEALRTLLAKQAAQRAGAAYVGSKTGGL
jgi:hypothetical protein